MKTAEQLAVITKKALATRTIGVVYRTKDVVADSDSGWRIQVGDEDEKCFDRLEFLELISLEEVCKLESDFSRIMEQPEEMTYALISGKFEPDMVM
jgi:hypothetical protein